MERWQINQDGFYLYTPLLYRGFYNYLSNKDYGLKISHLGDGYSSTLKQPRIVVTNYDFFSPIKGRFIYIKENNDIWSPTYYPLKNRLTRYCCHHAPGYTEYISEKNNLKVNSKLFLPLKGEYEIWLVTLHNNTDRKKNISFFVETEFLLYNSFDIDPVYYSWFVDSEIKNSDTIIIKKREMGQVSGFFYTLNKPDYYETSLKEFLGNGDIHLPESIKQGRLNNSYSGGDPYIGAFQFNLGLKPDEKRVFVFFLGIGNNTLIKIKQKYKNESNVIKEFEEVKKYWKQKIFRKEFNNLRQGKFKHYINTFFPYQIYQQSTGIVRSPFKGFRDVAQDAIGLSYFDKKKQKK